MNPSNAFVIVDLPSATGIEIAVSTFPPEVQYENKVWRRCANISCSRIFYFGDPEVCPLCQTATEKMRAPHIPSDHPDFKHGLSAYRHGQCRCGICTEAQRIAVQNKRQR